MGSFSILFVGSVASILLRALATTVPLACTLGETLRAAQDYLAHLEHVSELEAIAHTAVKRLSRERHIVGLKAVNDSHHGGVDNHYVICFSLIPVETNQADEVYSLRKGQNASHPEVLVTYSRAIRLTDLVQADLEKVLVNPT